MNMENGKWYNKQELEKLGWQSYRVLSPSGRSDWIPMAYFPDKSGTVREDTTGEIRCTKNSSDSLTMKSFNIQLSEYRRGVLHDMGGEDDDKKE
jgi:hypothetical protein